jgi:ABC-type sugar transport system ATPase subunit
VARIDLIDVCKTLTDRARGPAATFSIQNLSLSIPDGKTMVVLGPSGCGKTTLLKIIAGLIPPDSGAVRSDGVDVTALPPGDRRIGMVFQNHALARHLFLRLGAGVPVRVGGAVGRQAAPAARPDGRGARDQSRRTGRY